MLGFLLFLFLPPYLCRENGYWKKKQTKKNQTKTFLSYLIPMFIHYSDYKLESTFPDRLGFFNKNNNLI